MKPWEKLRREALGAWRSVRYDMNHRHDMNHRYDMSHRYDMDHRPKVDGDAGLTGSSAPMGGEADSWYSRPLPERESVWAPLRDPRRVAAACAVAGVIAASATGTFFAVTGGLGILLADSTAVPVTPESAPASAVVSSAAPRHRQAGPTHRPSPSAPASARPAARPAGAVTSVAPTAMPSTPVSPPHSPVPESTPSTTPSHSPSPSATSSSPSPSPSPSPSIVTLISPSGTAR